jgi:dipeptidyl aminopeptidase/acylaminoacyl peptidase
LKRAIHVLCCASIAASTLAPLRAGTPAPLDYRAYDGWNRIAGTVLSPDGATLAYVVTPQDGDPTLIVRTIRSGDQRTQTRGSDPAFAGNGRFVLFTYLPPRKDIDAAKKAEKPPAEQPKNGLGIIDLQSPGGAELIEKVRAYAYGADGGTAIAYLSEPTPAPSASPSPAASASPTPAASPKPKAADSKKKATASTLTIRDLASGTKLTVANVSEAVESENGSFIAYATETADGSGDGVHVFDVASGKQSEVIEGAGRYRNLSIARDGSTLAFLSDTASYATDAPHDALYVADLHGEHIAAVKAVDQGAAGLPAGSAPSANGKLAFSRDGARVFFGSAPAPTPAPSASPHPVKVDIWSWNDDLLQSQQRHEADAERKRTFLAVYDVRAGHFAQLGSTSLQTVERNENPNVALGLDDRAYRRATSWLGEDYADAYAVSLADGRSRLLARHLTDPSLSPGGRYVLAWDERRAHWVAYRTSDGRAVVLGAHAAVPFYRTDDDHPEPPQAFGSGGWFAGDRGVLLYDRYDVWVADPDTGSVRNLTGGAGRKTRIVYSPVQPDPLALAYDPGKPLLLAFIDERSLASGYARVDATGGAPVTLLRADEIVNGIRNVVDAGLHDMGMPPIASKNGAAYAFTRETFRSYELWTSNASFGDLRQVSNLNPQQAKYRWGTERLISYRGTDGTPLRAVMLVPDGLPKDRSAPMLVYFYETWSQMYHSYYAPAPGTSPNLSRYVSNGYVVLLPDVRYKIGHPGKSAVNCLLPAVDAAIATGYVNPARVGIAGHSWAAYQINYLITQTHRFRAAEAGAAVDDMFSAYGGIRLESGVVREFQYEHQQSRIGATPWDRPDLYLENSGIFGIKNVTTPYLTVHNDADTAVPQFQGIEYITAMRRLGKIAYLFSFDGEAHGILQRENQKYWTVHLDEWFDYWLKGAPRPSWFDGVPFLERGERNVDVLFGEAP